MKFATAAALAAFTLLPGSAASAASVPVKPAIEGTIDLVQYRPRGVVVAPRYFAKPVGPRFFTPRGYVGRPYWFARPWRVRPHYGTIFAGVALGTIVTVAALGYAPPRPAPNLCWYWADDAGSRGYWDYC